MLNLKKYFKLIYKDFLTQKQMVAISVFYAFIIPVFSLSQDHVFAAINTLMVTLIFMLNACYFYFKEKQKGEDFLITTSYTRTDLVLSKYVFLILISIFQIGTSYLFCCFNSGFDLVNVNLIISFLLNVLFANIAIACMTPFCFLNWNAFLKTVICVVLLWLMECLPMYIKFDGMIISLGFKYAACICIILSVVVIGLSIFISDKIFRIQDL